jgi:hypothetical protein
MRKINSSLEGVAQINAMLDGCRGARELDLLNAHPLVYMEAVMEAMGVDTMRLTYSRRLSQKWGDSDLALCPVLYWPGLVFYAPFSTRWQTTDEMVSALTANFSGLGLDPHVCWTTTHDSREYPKPRSSIISGMVDFLNTEPERRLLKNLLPKADPEVSRPPTRFRI